ncbi:hypothetical protein GCM10008910_45470 [Faecalicatena orotica]|uniref:Uncharacterized protein n=1 Tax=Faecalicatena orotica TaxID=1544 RepID=A0A2Y9BDH9_9FIRM|nr:hypothetical protein [Faecalicatena orotica]PWJ29509.1 hypothetical protein A8806_106248 [Faecalicatena orotica]SSA55964.1 hypothetical protein SAMN05216536_106248 [Faecalicatena orotica]
MITLTDEELQELRKEIKSEIMEQMKLNKLDTLHEDVQQMIETATPGKMTKAQVIEKIAKTRDPDERRKLITDNMELLEA